MRFFLLTLLSVGILAGLGIYRVQGRYLEVQLGFRLMDLNRQRQRLEDELQQLRILREALLAPKLLQAQGQAAGLRLPGPSSVLLIDREETHER